MLTTPDSKEMETPEKEEERRKRKEKNGQEWMEHLVRSGLGAHVTNFPDRHEKRCVDVGFVGLDEACSSSDSVYDNMISELETCRHCEYTL